MVEIDKIVVRSTFGGSRHTTVQFTNGAFICSCDPTVGFSWKNVPNLREFPYVDNDHICPECKNGKCINCTDVTLNDEDVMVKCLCPDPNFHRD